MNKTRKNKISNFRNYSARSKTRDEPYAIDIKMSDNGDVRIDGQLIGNFGADFPVHEAQEALAEILKAQFPATQIIATKRNYQ